MQDWITYGAVILLIVLTTYLYQRQKLKVKKFILAKMYYSFGRVEIVILKQSSVIKSLIIRTHLKENANFDKKDYYLEIKKNDDDKILLNFSDNEILNSLSDLKANQLSIKFSEFKTFLNSFEIEKKNKKFRFIIKHQAFQSIKTPYLALNQRWSLYVPDSGKYN